MPVVSRTRGFVVTAQQCRTGKVSLTFSDSFKGTNGERKRSRIGLRMEMVEL